MARFAGSVQGVVVQMITNTFLPLSEGKYSRCFLRQGELHEYRGRFLVCIFHLGLCKGRHTGGAPVQRAFSASGHIYPDKGIELPDDRGS